MSPAIQRQVEAARSAGTLARINIDQTLGDRVPADGKHIPTLWHADHVQKHLVCIDCGASMSWDKGIPESVPHTVGTDMRPCTVDHTAQVLGAVATENMLRTMWGDR